MLDTLQIIRNADLSEARLKEMLYLAIYTPPGTSTVSKAVLELPTLKRYYENWGSEPWDRSVAAELDGQAVGLVWGRAHRPPLQGFGFIDTKIPEISIAVKTAYRNQGLGTKLL